MEDRFQSRVHAALPTLPRITIPTRWNTSNLGDGNNSSIPKLPEYDDDDGDVSPSKTPTSNLILSPDKKSTSDRNPSPSKTSTSNNTTTTTTTTFTSTHHRPHIHRRTHHKHHTRNTIQSAIQLQNPFSLDTYNPLRRLEKSSHNPSNTKSQTNNPAHDNHSTHQHNQPGNATTSNATTTSLHHIKNPDAEKAIQPITRIIRPKDIIHERARRTRRADEVADALGALTRDAHTATRKLDDTYYALLERLGTLRATITSLKDLCQQASEARTSWEKQMEDLGKEVDARILAFEAFTAQESMVEGLVGRLNKGKKRAGEAEGRLEVCRGRLEDFQQKETRNRRKLKRRWRICWFALASLVLVFLALLAWRKGNGGKDLLTEMKRTGQKIRNKSAELAVEMGVVGEERWNKTKTLGLRLKDPKWDEEHAEEESKWMRVLDEL